ncbi:MAG: DUF2911 domain-containing protein [Flavobacteriaceae bacterium]|nr:DUF2911 domain-containing protein [Flavobacteriaceae bacterium]
MKNTILLIATVLFLFGCKNDKSNTSIQEHNENPTEKMESTKKKVLSPHTSAMSMVGDAHIHIDYSSPGVRDRIIFGGLVSYDSIWQAGAHMATWIEANKDLVINDETLKAGKYGFFVIPSQKEWTIIFNTNWEQHGKDEYDVKDDVIRFSVTPVISDSITEHLEYKVTKTGETEGVISLSWEKVTVSFSFKVRT